MRDTPPTPPDIWIRIRRFGKLVLTTKTDLSSSQVALKYKELWQVERVFRDVKSLLEMRLIFHQRDETIRGHVFAVFSPWFYERICNVFK